MSSHWKLVARAGPTFMMIATLCLLSGIPAGAQTAQRLDPIPGFAVKVEIQGIPGPIFIAELTGIGSESDVVAVEQKSASGQVFIQNVPGRLKWKDVVIKRALTADRSFWTWRAQVEKGDLQGVARTFSISFLDPSLRQILARWEGVGGWPSKLIISTPASASQATLLTEELTITHSGLTRTQ